MAKRTPLVLEDRLWSYIDKTDTCWLWTSNINHYGYGRFGVRARQYAAHRYVYELLVGPIPEGLHIDHLCRVRHCVNPEHLEPVTQGENNRRGEMRARGIAWRLAKTHCPHGHPYDEANTYISKPGWRVCRECSRQACRRRRGQLRLQREKEAA